MTSLKEAYDIVKVKHQNEKVVECLEFEDFFAFFFIAKDTDDNEEYADAYCTIQKKDGKMSTFNPTSDFEAYFSAKRIDVEELRKMQWYRAL